MELEFFGAAGEVTGSCHILRVGGHQVLLDCGLIQGSRKDEARNRDSFPFQARDIDAVVLSHAHIDHSGRLPLLVKRGFTGPIYAQNATKDLCKVLLEDSAGLSERDVEWENRRRKRKGLEPIEPLYTRQDARNALRRLRGRRYDQKVQVVPGVTVSFQDAGHIMGSAIVEVSVSERDVKRRLVFSGDLGQYDAAILRDPSVIEHADLVLMESTYGGRVHRDRQKTVEEIGEVISDARHQKGNILIPAFAVGRSQEVLYMLGRHYGAWGLGRWHVFLDSPMAIQASEIYWNYPHLYDDEATKLRLKVNEMPELKNLHLTPTPEESQVINRLMNGAIVIAGSGMCNGGRILHHLKHNVWRKECHVVIVGYQAQGSLGRKLVDGSKFVRIHGETVRVAAKVHTVGGLSAHGDRDDLARWYRGFNDKPPVYLVHGEASAAQAFRQKLKIEYGTPVTLARPGMKVDLALTRRRVVK
ncbi:MAG: MBL fold metallo-hydrolase [Gammaproteobacteria bacterium]|nr:MBL fold metallo-hydrolase [Gammaproteobacteria bacterium]